jgi:hypothetical protein
MESLQRRLKYYVYEGRPPGKLGCLGVDRFTGDSTRWLATAERWLQQPGPISNENNLMVQNNVKSRCTYVRNLVHHLGDILLSALRHAQSVRADEPISNMLGECEAVNQLHEPPRSMYGLEMTHQERAGRPVHAQSSLEITTMVTYVRN